MVNSSKISYLVDKRREIRDLNLLPITYPEDAPRAVLLRSVVQNLLVDPCNHIMSYDSDFIEDIISSALIYGMPLFVNSWNCGWCVEKGEATLVRALHAGHLPTRTGLKPAPSAALDTSGKR